MEEKKIDAKKALSAVAVKARLDGIGPLDVAIRLYAANSDLGKDALPKEEISDFVTREIDAVQALSCVIPSDRTEQGMAIKFAQRYGDTVRYVPAWGWTVYDGKVWVAGAVEQARGKVMGFFDSVFDQAAQLVKDCPGDKGAESILKWAISIRTARWSSAVLVLAQSLLLSNAADFEVDPWEINTQNGILDLRTLKLRNHDPRAMMTGICSVAYAVEKGERWEKFLDLITCQDRELKRYLQYLAGMMAVGRVYHEGVIFAFGGGANGKSTLFNALRAILGTYAVGVAPEILMASRARDEVRGLATLRGKRLGVASETEEGERLSPSVLKRLSSTDLVNARLLFHEPFDYTPTHTLAMFTNHLPKVGGNDDGIWRRIIAVPFRAQIIDGRIPDYCGVLVREEGSAILRWIAEGARMFHENGNDLPEPPRVVAEAVAHYRESEDWMTMFISDRCEKGIGYEVQSSDLYSAYRAWAEQNGEYQRHQRDFCRSMEAAGFRSTHTRKGAFWQGIRLSA